MKKNPNFFIVGAPKCGTTSVYEYLSNHPNVFLTKIKGPHYFATDFEKFRVIKHKIDYLHLYNDAKESNIALGEGSVLYLYSNEALRRIRIEYPDAKLIVLLRNPINLIQSWHAEMLWSGDENIVEFEEAWKIEKKRTRGEKIPRYCRDIKTLYYSKIGLLGSQLERLYKIFPNDQIKLVFLEDFRIDTKSVYKGILEFLSLPIVLPEKFPIVNQYKKYKYKWLQDFLNNPPLLFKILLKVIKKYTGIKRLNIFPYIIKKNTIIVSKPHFSPNLKKKITDAYGDDIKKLSDITGRDLNHWLG